MPRYKEFDVLMDQMEAIAKDLDGKGIEYGYPKRVMHEEADVPVAQVAAWNEEGVMNSDGSWRQPPRRFMTQSELLNQTTTANMMPQLVDAILTGTKLEVNKVLHKIGKASADDVRAAILYGQYPPLKQSTINQKGHDTPLLDTEQMYEEANYKISKGV